jgi:PIN domain nuclease of toxin-antitoxin system
MLSRTVRELLRSARVSASVASLWELVIKRRRSIAYPVKDPIVWWERHVVAQGIQTLPIRFPHIARLDALPFWDHHRDPLDRLLIAQALSENLSIVSKDRVFADYTDLKVIW